MTYGYQNVQIPRYIDPALKFYQMALQTECSSQHSVNEQRHSIKAELT